MDPILARTYSLRPANKIEMKCPSWPNTPLHQYFGTKRSKKKNMDFVLSSLGYLRLYDYSYPCGKFNEPVEDTANGSSFVHLEERHRSDEPYTLYRKPQRKFGIGLTERAREKRLLRYYKYFEGFQRKLQVSRQFQQNPQKRGNKASVKKIMNYYQPNLEPSGKVESQDDVKVTATNLPVTNEGSGETSKKENSKSKATDVQSNKTINDSKKSDIINGRKLPDVTFTDPLETNGISSLSPLTDTVNWFPKRKERCTIISTILATIEETFSDEENESMGTSSECSLLAGYSDLFNDKQLSSRTPFSKAISSSEDNESTRLRGILKYPKPFNKEHYSKCREYERETYSLGSNPDVSSSDPQIQEQQARTGTLTTLPFWGKETQDHDGFETGDSGLCSGGQLVISKEGTLRKVLSENLVRARPVLHRSGESSSSKGSLANLTEITDDDSYDETHNDGRGYSGGSKRVAKLGHHKEHSVKNYGKQKTSVAGSRKDTTSSLAATRRATKKSMGNIRFQGWDCNTRLGEHVLKELPDEKDLSTQILKRCDKLKREEQGEDEEDSPKWLPKSQGAKEYVEEKGILQMFEHFTQKVLNERSSSSLEFLEHVASGMAMQREQEKNTQKDMKLAKERPPHRSPCNRTEMHQGSSKQKRQFKPRYRVHSFVPNKLSQVLLKTDSTQQSEDEFTS